MYTGQVAVISNRATWQSDIVELVDDEDGATTDLTTVSPLDIEVVISDYRCSYPRVMATIGNGKVTVPGPGFQWQFEDTDLSGLCAGTYRLGVKVTIDGFITDLIDGTIAVVEGV